MKCVFLVCLLILQAVCAAKNITLSIDVPKENPADVSYVEGEAPEELKAGPAVKTTTSKPKETIVSHAAFIRSSNREIPKDDEIENEEFERFIKKYHSGPTIETVFVSTSPSPPAEDSEELTEETTTIEPEAEVFKRPAQLRTYERSVAHPSLSTHILPPPDHHPTYAIVNHQPHDASLHHGGSATFDGSDGYIFQSSGGAAGNEGFILQSGGGDGGQFVLTNSQGNGGEQQYYQFSNFVPRIFNVAQNAVKTKTFEIRRPAIQKHYYDIEERVIVRPAGSVIVELDRPVAKVPTGETVVAVGGLTGSLAGNGFQQSSQGGISFSNAFGINGGGLQGGQFGVGIQQSAGGFPGSDITYTSSVGAPSISGFQQSQGALGGGQGGIGFQQAQGVLGGAQGGIGFQQAQGALGGAQGGIGFQQAQGALGGAQGGIGFQQAQGALGGGQGGIGFQQAQGALGGAQGGIGFQQGQGALGGAQSGIGFQQAQGALGGAQGGIGFQQAQGALGGARGGIGIQQSQGGIGGTQGGTGFQQSQGGIAFTTTTPSPNGSPTSTVVIGTQQQQGGGIQQSQSGISVTTTPAPRVPQTSSTAGTLFGGVNGGFAGVGVQQGGISSTGFQQSQGGATFSTTAAPGNTQTSSTTNIFVGGNNGGLPGSGFTQTQGGSSSFDGSTSVGGFQQSQGGGGVYSTTGIPFFQSTTPLPNGRGFSGVGFQQSQGGIGISQGGGFTGAGFQQSQGGIYSTTPAPYLPPPAPTPTVLIGQSNGGFSGTGFQQSQSGIGLGQGGFSGSGITYTSSVGAPSISGSAAGFQQSQGALGGTQGGIGFQQSQGALGGAQGGIGFQQSQGALGGAQGGIGFQQSQGAIGGSQGGIGIQQSQGGIGLTQGDIIGSGFQQSQGGIRTGNGGPFSGGEIIYSTTAQTPSYSISGSRSILLRPQNGGSYPIVSTTTAGPIIISTLNQNGNNGNSFIVQANSNVLSKGSVSSTTTTERSFSGSAFAKASAGGSIQDVSKYINPFKITVREPNFSYPPYVEITSNGSPLGQLRQQPYTQASSQDYPRMRYQGKLLTGEIRIDDGLGEQHESQEQSYGALSPHHQNYKSPTYVTENPANSPLEEQSPATVHKIDFSNTQQSGEPNSQHHQQYVGSSKQPIQDSQISSSAYQQPDQIYQQHFLRTTSQPIAIPEQDTEQHVAQHQFEQQQISQLNDNHPISKHHHSAQQRVLEQHVAHEKTYPQQPLHQYIVREHQPIQRANYQTQSEHNNDLQIIPTTPIHQQHDQLSNQQPTHHNLVAQIRHQQLTPKQQSQVQDHHQQTEHHKPTESTYSKQKQVTDSLEEPLEVSEVHSSTHQQPTLFQQQVSPTVHTLEPYSSGHRQYKQRGSPLKYTQDQSLNVAPSEHTVYFNNNLEHTSARSQNIEIPPGPQPLIQETNGKSVESSTIPIVTASTTTAQRLEASTQPQIQRQTYASVLSEGKPGILYAPPKPVGSNHSPGHKQHFLRFSADGSSLFSPFGRHLHLLLSELPRSNYPHQSQIHSLPVAPIEPAKQHISVTNKGYQIQAQLPITHQSQIELSASNKPAPASEPQITRSQSHAASHQTSARYEAIPSTTPETATTATAKEHHKHRGPQKYRNEQTHGAITLRSGRTYGDHRVIASTPAPSNGGAASESVQTRRIVVNHPFQTVQEVVEREPFTNIHQVTVNAPAKQVQQEDGLQEGQQKSAAYRAPAPYKVAALLNHPQATLSFHHHGGSH